MSYRCQVCENVCAPRSPLLRHVVYREDKSILRETPVCRGCLNGLELGVSVADLRKQRGQAKQVPPPVVVYKPLPPILVSKPLTLGRPVKLLGKIVTATK